MGNQMKDLTENYPAKSVEGFYPKSMESDNIINQIEFPSDNCNVNPSKKVQEGMGTNIKFLNNNTPEHK
jgi:hypothetical protein